jgi:hypothetical protein
VEGIPGWLLLGIFVVYVSAVAAVVPAVAAVGHLLARRPHRARTLLAAALLGEAVAWAVFCFLLLPVSRHAEAERVLGRETVGLGLMGLSLLAAGGGQFVGAARGPRTNARALGLATAAVLVGLIPYWLDLSADWLDWLPDWNGLPAVVASLLLGGASLLVALRRPADAPDGGSGRRWG